MSVHRKLAVVGFVLHEAADACQPMRGLQRCPQSLMKTNSSIRPDCKLLGTSAWLLVTGALLVVTRSY